MTDKTQYQLPTATYLFLGNISLTPYERGISILSNMNLQPKIISEVHEEFLAIQIKARFSMDEHEAISIDQMKLTLVGICCMLFSSIPFYTIIE